MFNVPPIPIIPPPTPEEHQRRLSKVFVKVDLPERLYVERQEPTADEIPYEDEEIVVAPSRPPLSRKAPPKP